MTNSLGIFFSVFLFSLILFFFLFLNKIANILNIYDYPNKRKIHLKPVPLLGGLLIFIYCIFFLLFSKIENSYFSKIVLLSCIFFLIGIIDDKINLNANIKFILTTFFFLIFLFYNNDFLIKEIVFYNIFYKFNFIQSLFFSTLCLMLFLNALNMFDGINLQSLIFIFFFLIVLIYKEYQITFYTYLLVPILVLAYFNYKNKIFMGDGGIYIFAILLSLSIIDLWNQKRNISQPEIFMMMYLPGIDMLRVFFQRLMSRKSPFSPDKTHLHHYLLMKYGYNKTILLIALLIILPFLIYSIFPYLLVFTFSIFIYFIILFSIILR